MEVTGLNHAVFDVNIDSAEAIEMQSNTPPVFSNQNVITAQPPGGTQQTRRPIPVSTQDWISTPRSQLTALSGSHFLGNVEQLEIQQIVDLSTLLGRSGKSSQYRVKVPKAETLFLAVEEKPENRSNGFNFFSLIRSDYTLNIFDQCGEPAFVMKINFKWPRSLVNLRKVTVGSSNFIGTVEENFSIIGPNFTVYNEAREPLCNIFGPNVCGCCMYREAEFQSL
ncbi:phospholipid scramblase family member 5 isoform X2 [Calliopsis andreniformis]|uniref:phospholipid scramblase family member 5 isoform X2 n=1 Tax=Calliopsis andreniformis TaxID=337506 RepID=UPI003FCC77C2